MLLGGDHLRDRGLQSGQILLQLLVDLLMTGDGGLRGSLFLLQLSGEFAKAGVGLLLVIGQQGFQMRLLLADRRFQLCQPRLGLLPDGLKILGVALGQAGGFVDERLQTFIARL